MAWGLLCRYFHGALFQLALLRPPSRRCGGPNPAIARHNMLGSCPRSTSDCYRSHLAQCNSQYLVSSGRTGAVVERIRSKCDVIINVIGKWMSMSVKCWGVSSRGCRLSARQLAGHSPLRPFLATPIAFTHVLPPISPFPWRVWPPPRFLGDRLTPPSWGGRTANATLRAICVFR